MSDKRLRDDAAAWLRENAPPFVLRCLEAQGALEKLNERVAACRKAGARVEPEHASNWLKGDNDKSRSMQFMFAAFDAAKTQGSDR